MASENLLQITPQELRFKFETRKNIPVTLSLHNPGSERVAFKVKTTSPKQYCVKPSSGFVEPGTTKDVQVVMQAQREAPPQLGPSKDKFLVQCIKVAAEITELTADAFDASKADPTKKAEGRQETKIRVTLVGPPKPPSPVPEGIEEEPSPIKSPFNSERGLDLPAVTPELPPMPQPAATSQSHAETTWTKEPQAKLAETASAVQQKLQTSSVTSGGFTLIHLCIVALLAFLIGHYTS